MVKREQGTGDGERQEETVSYPDESTEEKEASHIPPRQSELAVPDLQGKPVDGILFYWKTGIIMWMSHGRLQVGNGTVAIRQNAASRLMLKNR